MKGSGCACLPQQPERTDDPTAMNTLPSSVAEVFFFFFFIVSRVIKIKYLRKSTKLGSMF